MTTPKPPYDDPDAPASPGELRAAADLRDALSDPSRPHEDAELARAVSLAHAPRELSAEEHRALLERALAPTNVIRLSARTGRRRLFQASGVAGALFAGAAAAAAILLLQPDADRPSPAKAASLVQVRSTQPLFREPFAREGGESARIDRIAMARASDLRENEFSRWGVR